MSQTEQPHLAGHLILMRDSDRRMEPGASALVLGVGGDTLICVAAILEDHKLHRPMSLDLLWQVHCSPSPVLAIFAYACILEYKSYSQQCIACLSEMSWKSVLTPSESSWTKFLCCKDTVCCSSPGLVGPPVRPHVSCALVCQRWVW